MGLKKFFKKNLRDIATVVGFAIGGPAGAAIGQGVGSVGEGRSLSKSLTSAAKVYGGASIATGAGLQGGGGSISFGPATPGTGGVGGFFQDVGAGARNLIGGDATFKEILGKEGTLATSYGNLGMLGKAGVIGTGLAGLGAFDPMEQPSNQMPGPAGGQYLTRGLTPATVSDVYGTGNMRGLPSMPGAQGSNVTMDPITMAYLDILRKQEQDYGNLAFPEFGQGQVLGAKEGGIARLADGGVIPQVDLREFGGDINDPNGSGDEDTVPALLADGEFVMTKQAVKGMGNGDHDQGIAMLYAMMNNNENKAQQMGIGRA
jgi:hypothetical protein